MVIIIGAGPAGLSAAYHLDRPYVLLEKERAIGGLCRSFELGGATFDQGGHAFFTKHADVRALLWSLCEAQVYQQPRSAWVYAHDTLIPYPFQANLYGLPVDVVEECLVGLFTAVREHNQSPPTDLRDWMDRSFGPGIVARFMRPYNEKIWAYPLDQIVPSWTAQRIVSPDVAAIVRGALQRVPFDAFPNATVAYPARGGFINFFSGFLPTVEPQLKRAAVVALDLRRREVHTDQGERLPYSQVVSTMPLTELVAKTVDPPAACVAAAAELQHNSLHLVNLVFERRLTEMQRIYCADPDVPFHKLVLNSNSSAALQAGPFAVQAEVSFSRHKPVSPDGLEERVLDSLRRMGLVTADDQPFAANVVTLPLAYPVYTRAVAAARETILTAYRDQGVYCAGRFGEWLYINSDDAVRRGQQVAAAINAQEV